ncbi:hypothetical protein SCUP234_05086 [Seiridium cupressi]
MTGPDVLDNLSRFYASQLGETSALIIRHDYGHDLEPDINTTTRFLVNLGIASWDLCQEASIIEPRQDFTDVEKEIIRTAWNTQAVRGIAQDTAEHAPAGQVSCTKIEGQYRFVAGYRELERKDFDPELARFKGLEVSDVTKSSTPNPATSFESVMDDDVTTEKFSPNLQLMGENDSGSGHGNDGNDDDN